MKPNHEHVHSVFEAEIAARQMRAKVIRNAWQRLGARLRGAGAGTAPTAGQTA